MLMASTQFLSFHYFNPSSHCAFLGHIQLLNVAIKRVSDIRFDSIEIKNAVTDWIAIPICWKDGKTETFKAFKSVLQHIIESDDSLFDRLVEIARSSGSTEIQKMLALCVNKQDHLGITPMHNLASFGNEKENIRALEFAVTICKNPNPQDDLGRTPMHIAVEYGHFEFVKALFPYWNNQMAKNQEGKTAIEIAEDKGHLEIAELLKMKIELC